jgi:hypothetical protein
LFTRSKQELLALLINFPLRQLLSVIRRARARHTWCLLVRVSVIKGSMPGLILL